MDKYIKKGKNTSLIERQGGVKGNDASFAKNVDLFWSHAFYDVFTIVDLLQPF